MEWFEGEPLSGTFFFNQNKKGHHKSRSLLS